MLQNARVSELLKENQEGGGTAGGYPLPQSD